MSSPLTGDCEAEWGVCPILSAVIAPLPAMPSYRILLAHYVVAFVVAVPLECRVKINGIAPLPNIQRLLTNRR